MAVGARPDPPKSKGAGDGESVLVELNQRRSRALAMPARHGCACQRHNGCGERMGRLSPRKTHAAGRVNTSPRWGAAEVTGASPQGKTRKSPHWQCVSVLSSKRLLGRAGHAAQVSGRAATARRVKGGKQDASSSAAEQQRTLAAETDTTKT